MCGRVIRGTLMYSLSGLMNPSKRFPNKWWLWSPFLPHTLMASAITHALSLPATPFCSSLFFFSSPYISHSSSSPHSQLQTTPSDCGRLWRCGRWDLDTQTAPPGSSWQEQSSAPISSFTSVETWAKRTVKPKSAQPPGAASSLANPPAFLSP